ncbi:hypothetical protein RRG08_062748 [Elysia crispata]|uniref:Uncharacterized protein n=1 Tax=Elysia crispata TaxID=231223 RepID=A0AAE1D1H2_9GAST|nr:hypothetical protein RRG08_062748 [Elysia crispata]
MVNARQRFLWLGYASPVTSPVTILSTDQAITPAGRLHQKEVLFSSLPMEGVITVTDSSSGQGRGTLNAGNSNGPGERTLSGIHPTRLVTLTRRSPQARTQPVLFPFSDFGGGQWKMVESLRLPQKIPSTASIYFLHASGDNRRKRTKVDLLPLYTPLRTQSASLTKAMRRSFNREALQCFSSRPPPLSLP